MSEVRNIELLMNSFSVMSLFKDINYNQLCERSFWVKTQFDSESHARRGLEELFDELFKRDIVLATGSYRGPNGTGKPFKSRQVHFWTKLDDVEEDFWIVDFKSSTTDELVPISDPIPLISQALALVKGYRLGYKDKIDDQEAAILFPE